MGVLHTDSLVLADGALAQAVLAGLVPLGDAQAGGTLALAWSLKHACEEAYLVDAAQAARATQVLADLAGLAAPAGHGVLTTLADWAAGLALLSAGTPQPALAPLQRAAAAWQAQGQALHAAQVDAVRLKALAMLGQFDSVAAAADACASRLAAWGDAQGLALLRLLQGDLGLRRHHPAAALAHYQDAAERLDRLHDHEHALVARIGMAQALVLAGQVPQARQAWQQAAQQAATRQLPALAAAVAHGRALFDLGLGHHDAALRGLLVAQQAFERLGSSTQATEVQRDLAAACLARRQLPEALAQYRSLVARLQGQSDAPALPWLRLHQARAMACAGQHAAAASALGWAQALFDLQPDLHAGPAGWAHAELARLQLVLDNPPDTDTGAAASAAAVAQQALALQPDLAAPLRAQARLLQVRAYRLAGALSAALRLLPALCSPHAAAGTPWLHAQALVEAGLVQLAVARADRLRQRQRADAPMPPLAWQPAAVAFDKAIQRFDDLQAAQPGGTELQHAGTPWLLQACEARLALAIGHESPEQALHWLHRLRLRQLRLSVGDNGLPPGADAAAVAHIGALRLQCFWLQRLLQRHLEDALPGSTAAWQAALQRAEGALLEATRQLRRQAGVQAGALRDGDEALDLAALCRHFQDGRALVAYAQVHGQLLALVVARGRVRRVVTGTGWLQLRQAVASLRMHLDTQGLDTATLAARLPQMVQRCTQRLQHLHALAWAPLLPALDGATEVVVVPSDALQAVPFAALHDGRHWLDQHCRLRMAATVALAARRADSPPQHGAATDVVASLWPVPDGASAGFFHRLQALRDQGSSTVSAMQRARTELRALHPHPSVWAAFSLNAGAACPPGMAQRATLFSAAAETTG